MYLSIIAPFHNEEKNITLFTEEVIDSLKDFSKPYEIILVNNATTDGSAKEAEVLAKKYPQVQLVILKVKGKGVGLAEGYSHAKGELIVFMDTDLQDDPKHLPEFVEKIESGLDLVNGVRTVRKDNTVIKVYSRFANLFLKNFMHSPFTDINCGFKIMRREVLEEFPLYANNFRFLPVASFYKGFRVGEIRVNNRERMHGSSKYGMRKLFYGLIDTITAYFIYQFSEKPLHFFGLIGMVLFLFGGVVTGILLFERIFYGVLLYRRPGLQFAFFFMTAGLQVIMTGFIGELIVYLHKRLQHK